MMEQDKEYSFMDCGQIRTGKYISTIENSQLHTKYHILLVGYDNDWYPTVIPEDTIVSDETEELFNIINQKPQPYNLFDLIIQWHIKYKSK